jgi:hypothetical protein
MPLGQRVISMATKLYGPGSLLKLARDDFSRKHSGESAGSALNKLSVRSSILVSVEVR